MLHAKSTSYELYRLDTAARGYIFGLRIPFVPDFLRDHTLLGREPSERINEFSARWVQFVSGLWENSGRISYCLHYDRNNATESIDASLLVRVESPASEHHASQALMLMADLERRLESFGFETEPLKLAEVSAFVEGNSYRYCSEVCQEEVMTPMRKNTPVAGVADSQSKEAEFAIPQEFVHSDNQAIYGLRPWWGSGGSCLMPFAALATVDAPVSMSILLCPAQLNPTEQRLMAEMARQAESLAQRQTKGMSVHGLPVDPSQNKTDPQLRWESRVIAANLRRLSQPFLCTVFCFSDDPMAVQQVANAYAATIREEKATEAPVGESELLASGARTIFFPDSGRYGYIGKALRNLYFDVFLNLSIHNEHTEAAPDQALRRLRYLMDSRGAASAFRFPISVEGGVPGMAVKQRPPDFHPGARMEKAPPGTIDLGRFHVGGRAYVSKNAFTKHALITGYTGSGKSNTSLYLLDQFWRKYQIPFLVIESAKKEYRGLRHVDVFQGALRIYTLGNETLAPLRFNPFELIPGVRLELHLAHLQTCFEGALPPVGPLPSVIAEALETVYQRFGWRLTDTGREREEEPRRFPTMFDFYEVVERVVASRGYQGEVKSNVEAAIKGRIKPLLMGSKGKMYCQRLSTPSAAELFLNPVVLELNDLNEDDKSLMMMFILTMLREYRELHPSPELCHVTLVEEAHNVLTNVSPGSGNEEKSDVKGKSVQSFCNMLAEIRAYGEGLIIADQSPEKLARDAMRNTNVQIAHQLRDSHDREAIANAMVMTNEQRDFLGKCETGRAAVFFSGLQKATFIDVPVYKDPKPANNEGKIRIENCYRGFRDELQPMLSDQSVHEYMKPHLAIEQEQLSCSSCQRECEHRDQILRLAEDHQDAFNTALNQFFAAAKNRKGAALNQLACVILEIIGATSKEDFNLAWCFTKEMWLRHQGKQIREGHRYLFEESFDSKLLEGT